MRLFRHIIAEHACSRCKRGRAVVEPVFSPIDSIAVAVASVPLVVAGVRDPWDFSCYCVVPILAGEILAVFAAGFFCSFLLILTLWGSGTCPHCGGNMLLMGRHFDPAGDRLPHHTDIMILAVFVVINGMFWLAYLQGRLTP